MINTFSSTIMRREMDSVLTCMVDERIGPGVLNNKFSAAVKQFFLCEYAALVRTPKCALKLALSALGQDPASTTVILWALAPTWQYRALNDLGYKIILLDSQSDTLTAPSDEAVRRAVNKGGNLLLLTHNLTTPMDLAAISDIGIPIIEDITNAIAQYCAAPDAMNVAMDSVDNSDKAGDVLKAGDVGAYSIMTFEERDTVTSGGGAVVMAIKKDKAQPLKDIFTTLDKTQLLPDLNCALGLVELREFSKNEAIRRAIYKSFERAVLPTKNKTLARNTLSPCALFPVILDGAPRDVINYAKANGIEVTMAFEDAVIKIAGDKAKKDCPVASSLLLKTVLFPLYPRLSKKDIDIITKVLATLP